MVRVMETPSPSDTYTEAETVARAEATLKRMLTTPHKPHKPKGAQPVGKPE